MHLIEYLCNLALLPSQSVTNCRNGSESTNEVGGVIYSLGPLPYNCTSEYKNLKRQL